MEVAATREEIEEAFELVMEYLGNVHPAERSAVIQKVMSLYERMYPGVYQDAGYTYVQHSYQDLYPNWPDGPEPWNKITEMEAVERLIATRAPAQSAAKHD